MTAPLIISMFDESGNALRPWAAIGCRCIAYDWTNKPNIEWIGTSGGYIEYRNDDFSDAANIARIAALRPSFVMGFPDCTHLAVSGTRSWERKRNADPDFQHKAVRLARMVETVGILSGAPWMAENPVGALATLWTRPHNGYFDPCHYGRYLTDTPHPRWPDYIPPRDAYTKKTGIWGGNGFIMPQRAPVPPIIVTYENGVKGAPQFAKLGGKSAKTKQIRSEGPRGFLFAVMLYNLRAVLDRYRPN